jgi:molybdopterin-containing oxidoreductase family iron-sulfur binding subunit
MHDGCNHGETRIPASEAADAATQGGPARRAAYWRSFEELEGNPQFQEFMHREFQPGASELEGDDRRHFIKIMGASFALAGLALAGCRRWPESRISEYASRPANRTPGVPVKYATSYELGGVGYGLLATSYDGRPIKLDGNPLHPASPVAGGGNHIDPQQLKARGAPLVGPSSSITQARILELYDPERSRTAMNGAREATLAEFDAWLAERRTALRDAKGRGLWVLAEPSGSPAMADMRRRLEAEFPSMAWAEWCAINEDSQRAGTKAAFGSPMRAHPDFAAATVVLSLDADFLGEDPNAVANSRAWAAGRSLVRRTGGQLGQVDPASATMSRVYQVEGILSLTGMNADQRLAIRPSEIAAFAAAIADRLGVDAARSLGAQAPRLGEHEQEIVDALVADLKRAGKQGLVVAGMRQPPVVHAIAAALNGALGAVGTTVRYTAAPDTLCGADIRRVAEALEAGAVDTLVILGGNPVYDAPADLGFAARMAKARGVVHLSFHRNETSRDPACTWHVPAAHFLESWGDTRAWDGTIALQQPLIDVLLDRTRGGLAPIELCSHLLGEADPTSGAIVRRAHQARIGSTGAEFDAAWRTLLDAGVVPGTAAPTATVGPAQVPAALLAAAAAEAGARTGHDLVFFNDGRMHDGRFANIGWLQELPDLVTKITWDNALLMSAATAAALGARNGSMVTVGAGSRSLQAAAWIVPGMADGTLALSLGHGRGEAAGTIGAGSGFNAYALRTSDAPWIARGATAQVGGGTYAFAHTQDHGVVDAAIPSVPLDSIQERMATLIRESSLEEYRHHPDFAKHATHVAHRLSLWEERNLEGARHRWAMTIDLSTCTGCSACVAACQAENNIPIVGKDQVARGREMHWIRVDRYFKGANPAQPDGARFQPVTCMQCENAPCEQVCPVAATVHDKDGLNNMVYNRCIGTRYCSNNCPYKVRRFNFFDFHRRDPVREGGILMTKPEYYIQDGPNEWLRMQFNPDVTVRMRGVMEKCTFCTQRIQQAKIATKNAWVRKGGTAGGSGTWEIPDGMIQTACQQACPTGAIAFGDLNTAGSDVAALQRTQRSYGMLEELNTKPRVQYLARVANPAIDHGAHDHGHDHGHGHASAAGRASTGANS